MHGTWVSGKRIETGDRVEMMEGDTLRVGGSSRVYRLHWVPLSCAYDFEGPKEKKKHEVGIVEEKAVQDCEKEISLLDETKETVVDSVFGSIEPLYSDENWNIEMMKEIPLAPPLSDVEEMAVSSVDRVKFLSDLRNESEQVETSLISIPFGNEMKGLEMNFQPPSLPLSADNLSFNVENIIMSSFFGSDSKSSSSSTNDTSSIWNITLEDISSSLNEKQQCHSKIDPSLPLSAENLSFNVENIIMSSFFDGESKSSSCNMFEWKETGSILTIPLENNSNNLSEVDDIEATPEYEYQQSTDENEGQRLRSMSLYRENSSDVQDTALTAFIDGEWESPSRNKCEQKEISDIMTMPFGHELGHVAVVDNEKPISDNESQRFVAERNLCSNFSDDETQDLPVHEVKSSSKQPLLALQSETVTEKNECMLELELHPLEDSHSSISTEKGIQEIELLTKIQAEGGEVYVDKGNGELYHHVTEYFLDCLSESKNDSAVKATSEVTPNSLMKQDVECCVEENYNARLETLEPRKSSVPREDYEHKELSEPSFISCASEYVYSSLLDEEVPPEISFEKECQTPHENLDVSLPIRSESALAMGGNIWLRRGKPTSFPRIETGVSRKNRAGTLLMDEINHEMAGDKSVINTLSHLDEEEEEEIFTPDKENFTPNTLLMKSLKKKNSIEDSGNCFRSSKSQTSIFKSRHKVKLEEELSEDSDKENQTPRLLQEQKLSKQISKNRRFEQEKTMTKKAGVERAPFQSLQSNIAGKKRPEATVVKKSARKSNISVCIGAMKNKFTVEGKKRWTMVVDTNSLLNKESMKSLQLLEGLQGTHLIVPRIVIRELDCLRRHGSLFRKTTEAASVLQWIEDCMVQARWWIHVQSSEEGVPPVTPPATPQSTYTEGSSQSLFWRTTSSIQSITQRSFMEALSPTPEDHILDCALHFRRGVNHGQLVLISDDVSLKIKAMAEGLICETAKEFRESLVNPFSERFLWADSSPRGLTWSCPDDMVLRERYDRCSSRSSKGAEGAKGLKLILLHNSQYGMFR